MKTLKVIILNLLILTISFLAIVLAGKIDFLFGLHSFQSPKFIIIGFLFVSFGVFLRSWAAFTFYDHHLRALELRPQHALMQIGPFAYSRNPLYISIATIVLGCAVILGSYTGSVFAIISFLSWHTWVYCVEEKGLEKTFGEQYRQYKNSVPRWLGFGTQWRRSPRTSWKIYIKSGCVALVLLIVSIPLSVTGFVYIHCPARDVTIQIEDHTVEIDGLTMYYRTAGNPSAAPLVFLHGWGATLGKRCSTDHVIEALSQHFYVVAPEHPGLIRSDAPEELWSYEEYAGALRQFLTLLQIKKPIIMGQSFGGGIASAYASSYPTDISSLVLVDSVMTNRPFSFGMRIKHTWDRFMVMVLDSSDAPTILKKLVINLYLGTPFEFISEDTIQKAATMPRIDMNKDLNEPLILDYRKFPIPFLLVWGDTDTWNTPIQRAREIHATVPGSTLIVIPGTHTVLYQRPQEIVGLIVPFLSTR